MTPTADFSEEALVRTLEEANIILDGHFVLKGGEHSNKFVSIKALSAHPLAIRHLGHAQGAFISGMVPLLGHGRNVLRGVIGPAIGGITLASHAGCYLSDLEDAPHEILGLFAEKRDGTDELYLGRGFDELIADGTFVVVEDVTTSGSSIKELVELVHSFRGTVLFVVAVWNRGEVSEANVGVPVYSLINRTLPKVSADECRATGLCSRGIPINTKHGHGSKYVAEHGQPARWLG